MPQIPEFKEEGAVFSPVQINDKSKSFDEFARQFGETAEKSAEGIVKIEDAQSKAQLMTAQTSLQDLSTNTQIQYLKNPDQAAAIFEQAKYTADSIKKAAYINDADRQTLNSFVDGHLNQLALKSAEVDHQQQKENVATTFYSSLSPLGATLHDQIHRGDFEGAEKTVDLVDKNAKYALSIHAITPQGYLRIIKQAHAIYDNAQSLHDSYKKGDTTAEEYNKAIANPYSQNPQLQDFVADGNAQYLADQAQSDRSFEGQYAGVFHNRQPDNDVLINATPSQLAKMKVATDARALVNNMIRTNIPLNQIQAIIDTYSADSAATPLQQAAVKFFNTYKEDLATGESGPKYLNDTGIGVNLAKLHKRKSVAIQHDPNNSTDETFQKLRANDNLYWLNQKDLLWQTKAPLAMRNVTSQETIRDLKSGFMNNGPLDHTLNRMAYLNPELRADAAAKLPKPHQSMAAYVIGVTVDTPGIDRSFPASFLKHNQDPRPIGSPAEEKSGNEKNLNSMILSAKEVKGAGIWNKIQSYPEMQRVTEYISKWPDNQTKLDGLAQATLNHVNGEARDHNDLTLANDDNYIQPMVKNISSGIGLYGTPDGLVSKRMLGIDRDIDGDMVISYGVAKTAEALKKGRTEQQFLDLMKTNPIQIVSWPDKSLVALDRNNRPMLDVQGKIAFHEQYNANVLNLAHQHYKENRKALDDIHGGRFNIAAEGLKKSILIGNGEDLNVGSAFGRMQKEADNVQR